MVSVTGDRIDRVPVKQRQPDPIDRNRILDVAAGLISERGYRGTNLSSVAERLGVTRQALYHHFSRKDEILYSLIDRTMSIFETRVLGVERSSAADTFATMLREHALICAANTDLIRISQTEDRELPDDMFKQISQRRRAYHRAFINAYKAGVEAGELVPTSEVSDTISFLLAGCQSMAKWYRPNAREMPNNMAAMIANLICTGIFPRNP